MSAITKEPIESAVLLAISQGGAPYIPLTLRSEKLKAHPAQISLPGGKRAAGDHTLADTAKRECEEEIGIPIDKLTILDETLPQRTTHSGVLVTPFIATFPAQVQYRLNGGEVAKLIQLPLSILTDLTAFELNHDPCFPVYTHKLVLRYEEHFIWGVTATILHDFALRLPPLMDSLMAPSQI